MMIQHFYDTKTSTLSYVVFDENTYDAIVIDPVLDYDLESGNVDDAHLKIITEFIHSKKLNLHACLETHVHADHLSGAHFLKRDFPKLKVFIGEEIKLVQKTFKDLLKLDSHIPVDGRQFDHLIKDGEVMIFGTLTFKALSTPGHTPACMSYLIGDALFTGDALFIEDSGTGRCDFPNGSAEKLYHSVHEKIYGLPDSTRVFVGHDYRPGGRELRFETTIARSKKENIHLKNETTKDQYVEFRVTRDQTLPTPKLLTPSLIVNIQAGQLPDYESPVRFIDVTRKA